MPMAFLWFQVRYARDLFGKWGERGEGSTSVEE